MTYQTKYRSFFFGSSVRLSQNTLDRLILIFRSKQPSDDDFPCLIHLSADRHESILNGRGIVKHIKIPESGHVVVKDYKRGGLVYYFNQDLHINIGGKIRSQREFDMLVQAKKAGVNVPEPVAYAGRGSLFYRTWLITKRINNYQNFADLSLKDSKRAVQIFPEISDSIKKLIKAHIYHVDLHPGNILIDMNNKNYIIDFDKAFIFKGSKHKLIRLYKKRWARAVLKYHLPDFILIPDLT